MNSGLVVLVEAGRAKSTRLTARGEKTLKAGIPLWNAAQKEFSRRLRKQDIEAIDDHLHSLIASY
jgi:hypothetical protein